MNKGEIIFMLSTVFGGFVSYVNANAAGAGQTWFDAGIAGYAQEQSPWPSDGTDKIVENEGTWSGTTNATYDTEHDALVVNAGTNPKFHGVSALRAATPCKFYRGLRGLTRENPAPLTGNASASRRASLPRAG